MRTETAVLTPDLVLDTKAVRSKVLWRIVPLILLLYIVAYLDRANASFAKLKMQEDLNFSDEIFGWGFGLFYAGYLFLEIPGALLVEYWSARKWFARILFTWGLCSMATAFVRTSGQFYLVRFILGLAEAGFYPGVIVYLTHWFPRQDRARAMAGLVFGFPLSMVLGARISGTLLEVNWFGINGWQWVFLIEGFPAVLLGVIVWFCLKDRPGDATWLTPAERHWLEQTLEDERQKMTAVSVPLTQVLRHSTVWLLALGVFVTNIGGFGLIFWLPTVVQNLLTTMGHEASSSTVLNWTSLFYLCSFAAIWLAGQSSDRTGERKWHCVTGQMLAGVCLAIGMSVGQSWNWIFTCLCMAGFFAGFWQPPFWVLPTLTLPSSAAAASIGFINMCANTAGIVGPPLVGWMKTHGFDARDCILLLAGFYILGGLIIALLPVSQPMTASKSD